MSKRLPIVPNRDYREIQRSAQSRGMSIAEWVRQAFGLGAQPRTGKHDRQED